MTKKKSDTKKSGNTLKFAAALVGLAAIGHYLHGPKGKENRAKIKAWTVKAKGEVLEQFEKKKEITEDQYNEIVEKTTKKYGKLKNVTATEAKQFKAELLGHWEAIKKTCEKETKKKK